MSSDNTSFEELLENSMKENKKLEKVITGKVISISSNGEVFVDINYKNDGIIPKSEYSFNEEDDPRNELKPGDEITCQRIGRDETGNVLLSYKRLRNKVRKENFWKNIEVGKTYDGIVVSISSYGAFIDIAGEQGLLHISEITWDRSAKVSDILKEGQKIKVTVKELDMENKRFKLSYNEKGEDPWKTLKVDVSDVVKVKIKKIMPFGAFAEIVPGVEGLIHISQISEERIAKPEDKLEIGQEVNAKIINIDIENKKIELSIKEIEGTSKEEVENNE